MLSPSRRPDEKPCWVIRNIVPSHNPIPKTARTTRTQATRLTVVQRSCGTTKRRKGAGSTTSRAADTATSSSSPASVTMAARTVVRRRARRGDHGGRIAAGARWAPQQAQPAPGRGTGSCSTGAARRPGGPGQALPRALYIFRAGHAHGPRQRVRFCILFVRNCLRLSGGRYLTRTFRPCTFIPGSRDGADGGHPTGPRQPSSTVRAAAGRLARDGPGYRSRAGERPRSDDAGRAPVIQPYAAGSLVLVDAQTGVLVASGDRGRMSRAARPEPIRPQEPEGGEVRRACDWHDRHAGTPGVPPETGLIGRTHGTRGAF